MPGLVTEALLHGDNRSTLLIAAEAYSRSEGHLHDESVVELTDRRAADVSSAAAKWLPLIDCCGRRRCHRRTGRLRSRRSATGT